MFYLHTHTYKHMDACVYIYTYMYIHTHVWDPFEEKRQPFPCPFSISSLGGQLERILELTSCSSLLHSPTLADVDRSPF